ncbi:MAG: ribose 5-phosphate isomerase B [Bacillota bacterium]
MRVAVGADHGGYLLKQEVMALLGELGIEAVDFGTYSPDPVDYPDIARAVAEAVARGEFQRGILLCGTGIGMCIAANKVPGIRAALCHDVFSAKATRNHNDSNVLCMGGRVVGPGLAREIVKAWLSEGFDGGRHQRRLDKIARMERDLLAKGSDSLERC